MGPIPRFLDKLEKLLSSIAVLALVIMMLAVTADAAMRYAFNAPIHGTQDLVAHYLMVAAYFCILSGAYSRGAQIRIDFVLGSLAPGLQHAVEAVGCFATTVLFALIAWLSGSRAWNSFLREEVLPGSIPWPIWLTYALVSGGSALLAFRLFVNGIGHVAAALGRGNGPALPSTFSGH
ncbi:TRAP transporter small permease [Paracoccus sp. SCSIO 75233]|uniref:TRAP transporter small permease n=1 Tax=Paracoccus sp. SCSIO 75233 TaxID=3017782 RepID=UPI0022F10D65|nr:TRAP transporter small permease [Paracoccus sp. SCSIO 75233]WBU52390.1 TRAP transporter small permease [Paracoccus sp. SCSIO 75233]